MKTQEPSSSDMYMYLRIQSPDMKISAILLIFLLKGKSPFCLPKSIYSLYVLITFSFFYGRMIKI